MANIPPSLAYNLAKEGLANALNSFMQPPYSVPMHELEIILRDLHNEAQDLCEKYLEKDRRLYQEQIEKEQQQVAIKNTEKE